MNAEERREARRKRILENSESRLKKITTLTINENVSNENEREEFIKDKHGNNLTFTFYNNFNFYIVFNLYILLYLPIYYILWWFILLWMKKILKHDFALPHFVNFHKNVI